MPCQFVSFRRAQDSVLKWSDVPTRTIFKVEKMKKMKTDDGDATFVELVDLEGNRYRAWAPAKLQDDLKGRKKVCYIRQMENNLELVEEC